MASYGLVVATAAPARRTQAERRASTRTALLDATVASLVVDGASGTTTTAVCRRAGVSQGALFKHFATKDELLAAVAAHLYDRLSQRWLAEFAALPATGDDADRVRAAVELLWTLFRSPEHGAALELAVAARTDVGLRRALAPVVAEHAARLRRLAAERFPANAGRPAADAALDVILEAMLGMALSRAVDGDGTGDPAHERRVLDRLGALAIDAFAPDHPERPEPAR